MSLLNGDSGNDVLGNILSSQAAAFSKTALSLLTPTIIGGIPFSDTLIDPTSSPVRSSTPVVATPSPATKPTTTPASTTSNTPVVQTPASVPSSASQIISSIPSASYPTSSSSATVSASAAAASTGDSKSSGASSAAIGVTVTIFILVACGAAFYLIRKRNMDKRKERRMTWNPPQPQPAPTTKFMQDVESGKDADGGDRFETIDIDEKAGPAPLPNNITYQNLPNNVPIIKMPTPPPALAPAGMAPPRLPSPPPMPMLGMGGQPVPMGMMSPTAGAPVFSSTPFAAIPPMQASVLSSNASMNSAPGAQVMTGAMVVVARTFVPSLPDELSIQTGEQVRIIMKYDDGWAHVERLRSGAGVENGVVPVECLETVPVSNVNAPMQYPKPIPGMGMTQEAVETWRLSKRKSSLAPSGPAQY